MTISITFVPATPDDIDYYYTTRREGMMPHMAKIGRAWNEDFERKYNREHFDAQLPYLRIICANGKRTGFIAVRPDKDDAVYLESFCIERRYQSHGISEKVIGLILQEHGFQNKKFVAEIMKGYSSGRLAEKAGFRLIEDTGELDLYERQPASR